ncbi:MAG: hypothetical protein IH935_10240 [Acidobacteria bacterium]|nr:hypothetical protein [Acidobacteriota bacterium]
MGEEIRIWYDEEGDYIEVLLEKKAEILERQATPAWAVVLLAVSTALMASSLVLLILQKTAF